MHPRRFAQSKPDHPAIIVAATGETISYAALEARANQGAHALRALGLRAGDGIALYLPTSPDYLLICWAAQRAGLYVVPVPTRLTASEAAYIVDDSDARLLLLSPDIAGAAALAAREIALPQVEHVLAVGGAVGTASRWEDALAGRPETPIADESAGTVMPYSSGTTGRPKGLRLPLGGGPIDMPNRFAEAARDRFGMRADSVFLSPAPIYHSAPLIWSHSAHRLGATVVMMPKFDAEALLATVERRRVTFLQLVPTMFVRLLRLPDSVRARYDLSSLRTVLHAAAPCPVPVKRAMIDWMGPIVEEFYSASEGLGSTAITSAEWLARPGSVGRASNCTLHICDDDGHELPPGEDGTIFFGGGYPFDYHKDPAKTARSRHPTRPELATVGDVGRVDADGYLFLSDRRDFMIISGGVNIYPQEVENELILHPAVADAAVFGVPNADYGEEVKAVVQPVDWDAAGPVLESALITWLRERLSPIKCPRSIDFEPQLPRHDTGKLFKTGLRDRYRAAAAAAAAD